VTNQIALSLGIIIVALVGADLLFGAGVNLLFLAKQFMQFLEWTAFWR
jgi:hypothetical protein